jgi:hypothetical protein
MRGRNVQNLDQDGVSDRERGMKATAPSRCADMAGGHGGDSQCRTTSAGQAAGCWRFGKIA